MKRRIRRHNLTLLELVIALAILAALSVVVLDNFSDMEMRERERQTIEHGERVKRIMTGADEKDGISRFLSDMGRWPKVTVEDRTEGTRDHRRNLAQLYDRSVFHHRNETETMLGRIAEIDTRDALNIGTIPTSLTLPVVSLSVGWSGPYLNLLKSDGASFSDPWGHSWKIVECYYLKKSATDTLEPDYTVAEETESRPTAATEIDGIVSFGADDVEGGSDPSDRDHEFIFAHDLNLATLTVTLKVRDGADPSVWKEPKNVTASAYVTGQKYDRDDVVFLQNAGLYHYYTCIADDTAAPPYNGDYTQAGDGWRYGVSPRLISAGESRVLLFAPARRRISTERSAMEAGFYRFMPYLSGAPVAERFPALRCFHSGAEENDADATADGSVDQNVDPGERNTNRLRAKSNWEYSATSFPTAFRAEWLIPGKRRIYALIGFYHNGTWVSGAASSVEYVDLKPGNNYITLHLERVK